MGTTAGVNLGDSVLRIFVEAIDNATGPLSMVAEKLKLIASQTKALEKIRAPKSITEAIERSMAAHGGFLGPMAGAERTIGRNIQQLDILDRAILKTFNGLKKVKNEFDFRFLSIMFFGMILQRTFSNALRSLFDTYTTVIGVNDQFFQKTQHLRAGWEFLKFSIINALSQSDLFLMMIDFLIAGINWLSELINKYPALGTAIVVAFGVLAVGGAVLAILANFKFAWDAVFGPGGLLAKSVTEGMGTIEGKSGTIAGAFKTGLGILKNLVGTGIALYLFSDIMGRGPGFVWTTETFVKDLGLAALSGYLLGGPWGALAAFSAVLVFDLIKSEKLQSFIDAIQEKITYTLNIQPGGFTAGGLSEAIQRKIMESEPESFNTRLSYDSEGRPVLQAVDYGEMEKAVEKGTTSALERVKGFFIRGSPYE